MDFKEHESAVKAVQELNEHEIDSRRIFVAKAQTLYVTFYIASNAALSRTCCLTSWCVTY